MRCDLTDKEDAALARRLSDTINNDRYPLSPQISLLKGILDKIRPERAPAHRRRRSAKMTQRNRCLRLPCIERALISFAVVAFV